ncbi:hypothetical protein LTR80_011805 [Exophiala xenobiotica]
MQLLMPPSPIVYLVDVYRLGAKAFDLATADGTTLQTVPESPNIFKVSFDTTFATTRMPFTPTLASTSPASRSPGHRVCHQESERQVRQGTCHIPGWSLTKANGRRPFAPEAGGNYEVFLERPMAGEILKYYDQDVMLMPRLLTVYGGKLQAGVAAQLQGIVDERIRPSKTDTFDGQGRHMAAGPHLAPTRYTNMSTSRELELVRLARLVHFVRLDDSCIDGPTSQLDAMQVNAREATTSAQETSSLMSVTSPIVLDAVNTSPTSRSPPVIVSDKPIADDRGDDDDDEEEEDSHRTYANVGGTNRTGYTATGHDSDSDRDFHSLLCGRLWVMWKV